MGLGVMDWVSKDGSGRAGVGLGVKGWRWECWSGGAGMDWGCWGGLGVLDWGCLGGRAGMELGVLEWDWG